MNEAAGVPCAGEVSTIRRCPIDRIEALVADDYTTELEHRDEAVLRTMKADVASVENTVSYYRRLAQGRMEILSAEQERRTTGGSVADLVAKLPEILGADRGRSNPAHTRGDLPVDMTIESLEWRDGREKLLEDASLASLPVLADDSLRDVIAELADFERELSDYRRRLHHALDAIELELARRAVADADA